MTSSSNSLVCKKPYFKTKQLPPWKVILHNDDINRAEYVIEKVQEIARLEEQTATLRVIEAHENEIALLLITHQEKAEFIVEQFLSCKITVTMEKA